VVLIFGAENRFLPNTLGFFCLFYPLIYFFNKSTYHQQNTSKMQNDKHQKHKFPLTPWKAVFPSDDGKRRLFRLVLSFYTLQMKYVVLLYIRICNISKESGNET